MSEHKIQAENYQFYLADKNSNNEFESIWDDLEQTPDLLVSNNALVVATEDTLSLEVSVTIVVSEIETDDYLLVNEKEVSFPTGKLFLYGGMDMLPESPTVTVTAGDYKATLYYKLIDEKQIYIILLRQ